MRTDINTLILKTVASLLFEFYHSHIFNLYSYCATSFFYYYAPPLSYSPPILLVDY